MKKIFIITSCIILFCHQICCAQLTERESEAITKFEKELKTDIAKDALDGSISAVVIKKNKVIWAKAFGYANRDTRKLADTGTIYRIASITKTFTATLLMMLVEDKKISLDDPAEKYVPEVGNIIGYGKDTRFTIRQLASHISGLQRWSEMPGINVGSVTEWQSKLLSSLAFTSFESKPGKQWFYSDVGFCILGLALERAAGQPYMEMIKDRIIKPLHMTHTFFTPDDASLTDLAQGLYNPIGAVDTSIPLAQHKGMGYGVPNGGLYSTPTDLAKFISTFIVQPGLLTKASIRQMQLTPKGGKNYGLGIASDPRTDVNFFGHNGLIPGYSSQYLIEEDSKYAVILMRNYNVGVTNLTYAAAMLLEDI